MKTLLASAVPGKLGGGEKEMKPERSLSEGRGRAKKQVVRFAGEEAAGSPLVCPGGRKEDSTICSHLGLPGGDFSHSAP